MDKRVHSIKIYTNTKEKSKLVEKELKRELENYTFFIDDVGVKSNCTISSDFNIILRKRTTAKTENPVFLQWFFSCLNRIKQFYVLIPGRSLFVSF